MDGYEIVVRNTSTADTSQLSLQEAITSNGKIGKYEALALGTWNIEKLLGISADIALQGDMVALRGGGLFDFESRVIGILSSRREQVELL